MLDIRAANQLRFAQLMEEGIAKGEFKPVDPQIGAIFIAGVIREVMSESSLGRLPKQTYDVADDIVRLLYEGIGC